MHGNILDGVFPVRRFPGYRRLPSAEGLERFLGLCDTNAFTGRGRIELQSSRVRSPKLGATRQKPPQHGLLQWPQPEVVRLHLLLVKGLPIARGNEYGLFGRLSASGERTQYLA